MPWYFFAEDTHGGNYRLWIYDTGARPAVCHCPSATAKYLLTDRNPSKHEFYLHEPKRQDGSRVWIYDSPPKVIPEFDELEEPLRSQVIGSMAARRLGV